jgi:ATP-dependent helicase/nuclease subunit B
MHPYGDGAYEVLSHTVRRAKEGDPFAPVTVVVDRGGLALAVRRRLAATPPGVVHLRCTTWTRLAAELAAAWLSSGGRTVASRAVELEAVRSALVAETPPHLAGALDQPSTLRALARTYRDLSTVPDAALDELAAQSRRTRDVIGVVRRVRAALACCVGAAELLEAAAAEVERMPEWAARLCGDVAVHLPRRIATPELSLLEALGSCTDVEVIVGSTGDAQGDGPARDLVARLVRSDGRSVHGGARDQVGGADIAVPIATRVRSAPTADAEVLMALRHLMGRNAEGVPLERMALLHSGAAPYRQLVHDVVARASLPTYGGGARPLSATVAGRALTGALGLPDHDWRRDDVVAWFASAPLVFGGHLVPAAEWDALSAEAGVVSGLDQWRERLSSHAAELRAEANSHRGSADDADPDGADAGDAGPTGDGRGSLRRVRRLDLDARRCDELREFLDGIAERLDRVPDTWAGWSEWAAALLADVLGTTARRASWPAEEVVAFDAVAEVLGKVGALDWLRGSIPSSFDFRTALGAELDAPAPQTTRFGHGLLVGRVQEAIGLDLDVVCVVGMVDGAFPSTPGDDVLVPDRERELAGPDVPRRGADAAEGRRDFFAALASAGERLLSYSRYDQRHGRELRPARILLESVEALAGDGRRFSVGDLRDGTPPSLGEGRFQFVTSYAEAVRDGASGAEPLSEADWRLRSLTTWVSDGGWVADHFLAREDPALAGALTVRRARRSARFTRFDGLVEQLAIPSPATGAVQSATGLESFARCPRRYFFSHLLRLTARDAPEAVLQLSPAERGVIVHAVLERLVAEEIAWRNGGAADAGHPGADEDPAEREARMLRYAEAEFAEARRRGVTGHPALWELERSRMTSDLREQLRVDTEYRSATGAQPVAVELTFGSEPGSDVAVQTPAGAVRFRGRIDRIDELADGSIAVVDYKSGKPYRNRENGDPLSGGERLQLPVYALAAKASYGADRRVRAGYWFVGNPTPPEWTTLDDAVHLRLIEVVATLAEGIETGRFPARPGPSDGRNSRGANCTYCPFDAMCPPDRGASWRRKRADPALASYTALAGET